ncbi:LysR family transcriptional regulator [Paracoccus sp. Z330]|uniref:LysR family transcriptional regulator n=1 Tax=Paracoccus onchidii TaxID=3017813 RepID=A0ABT4ZAC9_9RHOB|nr:LysR family transcriptional regulator [Paracoccus onchidii]MDB6176317.1 LysR family transcriptional regulator [Paracoccus onchidii]
MPFDFVTLQLVVNIARMGAIGRGGRPLGLSATNASLRVRELEDDLGVQLFNRTTRKVSLTADGEEFLTYASRIVDTAIEARAALSQKAQAVGGKLRVTASATFGQRHIVPYLPEFFATFPDIKLDLFLSDRVVDIVDDGFSVAFRIGSLAPSSLLARKIDDNPVWLVAAPSYLARHGQPETPQDLARHRCLPLGAERNWTFRDPEGQFHEVQPDGPLRVNLGDSLESMALAGLGIARASLWAAGKDIREGRLVPIMPSYKVWPETCIWAVRPPEPRLHARTRAFVEFMQTHIRAANLRAYGDLLKR